MGNFNAEAQRRKETQKKKSVKSVLICVNLWGKNNL
jgi:hypothetical protein